MDYGHGIGAQLAIGMDMGHDVMAQLFLESGRLFKVDILDMGPHFVKLFVGYIQAQLLLGLGQIYPQPAPCGKLELR